MDPMKHFGNIKENVEREDLARRHYPKRWGFLSGKDIYKFYNQTEVNAKIATSNLQEQCPYQYTGHGDSYFVSKDMYNTLLATCRCGRPKSNLHLIKCFQKIESKCGEKSLLNLPNTIPNSTEADTMVTHKIPETTAGMIGWLPSRYSAWERTTYYVSPKCTMPGYKINDHPYSTIFIG